MCLLSIIKVYATNKWLFCYIDLETFGLLNLHIVYMFLFEFRDYFIIYLYFYWIKSGINFFLFLSLFKFFPLWLDLSFFKTLFFSYCAYYLSVSLISKASTEEKTRKLKIVLFGCLWHKKEKEGEILWDFHLCQFFVVCQVWRQIPEVMLELYFINIELVAKSWKFHSIFISSYCLFSQKSSLGSSTLPLETI